MAVPTKDLLEFLTEAELQNYHSGFVTTLKVNTVPQLKYVEDEDLAGLGMSKPEIRRLRQFFKKEHPRGAFIKIKKILTKGPSDTSTQSTVSISPPILEKTTTPSKHIISEDSVVLLKIIGTGEFGYVQQGVWTKDNGEQTPVAVKCLPKDMMKAQTSEFLQEATVMQSVCHPHIVQLYGVILGADSFMLVTELAPLKSMLECLKDPMMKKAFTIGHLCDLASQLADGMAYLEKNRLIHRDLAARNVLMFAEDKVKISDFGLSRALGVGSDYYQGHLNTGLKLPIAWCAPECINFLKFTSSSDVWSFGVLLWEMFSFGEQPWTGLNGLEIMQEVDAPNFQRLPGPPKCPDEWYNLMNDCWKPEASDRPKFTDIYNNIQQMKPTQVIMLRDTPVDVATGDEYLRYKTKNVVTVLSKSPSSPARPGLWKGLVELTGDVGYFDYNYSSPYIEVIPSTHLLRKIRLNRTESARLSIRNAYKATPNLISKPQNDLRHLGHVGYDGVCFGDVSFIGNNYDKLPLKVSSTRRSEDDLRSSRISLPVNGNKLDGGSRFSGFSMSSSTLTDGPVLKEDDEFADFKLPSFSNDDESGSSLMEEVLKVLSATTAEDDDEMKGLLAGFENLGLSINTKPGSSVSTTKTVTNHQSKDNRKSSCSSNFSDSKANISEDKRSSIKLQPSLYNSSSVTSHKPLTATYNNISVVTNGMAGVFQRLSEQPSVVSTSRDSRASSEVSGATPTNEAESTQNGDDNGENDETDYVGEEEEEGSLFESSSYSSGKEASEHYNGLEDDKKSKHSDQSPIHNIRQQEEVSSPTSSKSGSLHRFSGDESKQSPTVSSSRISISSPRLMESSSRLPVKKSLESSGSSNETDSKVIVVTTLATPTTTFTSNITTTGSYSSRLNAYIPSSTTTSSTATRSNLNQKFRVPIIPGRQAPIATTDDDDQSAVDTNPLRRLRQSAGSTGPRPMMTFRPAATGGGASTDQPARNINVNSSFFDKLKEQQRQQ